MTQSISCADYLKTLSDTQLRCWIRLNLSYDQIANAWLARIGSPMDKDMPGQHLSRCIIKLVNFYGGGRLNNKLAKQCGDNYKLLPDSHQLEQIAIDFINIAKKQNLTTLDLSCLLLHSLPDSLFQLFNLEHLYLDYNSLNSLPPEIGSLSNLSYLNLSYNKLTSLPVDFANLSNLTTLDLSSNKLTSLPIDFANLSNLITLDLRNNQLTSLPTNFAKPTNLRRLNLHGNNLLPIPPEILILKNEPTKILNYYFQLLSEKEKKQLNEAKMLVVGEGKVGKTSIVNKLVHNIFNDPEPMTEGVIIKKHWPITLSDNREIKLNIWDFGGQEIMHATHQFFLTKRSLYLLVLDARQDEQQNRLDYWLKTIENFADDAPIIIVCNQIDVKGLELDQKTLKAKYPNIKAFVSTSCKTGKSINTLKEAITEEISKLKHIDDLLVASWFKIKEQLETLQKDHKDYLAYSEYHQMCEKENIDTLSEETLISFLHALGTVLCFHDDPRVNYTYILNPDWVTEGVYKIINNRELADNKGVLQISTLSQILNSQRYPKDKHGFIIEMMRKFELCFELEGSNGSKLLIPDLLPKQAPEFGNWDDSLKFEYHYDLLPSSVISRFIVKTNSLIHQNTYWRYGIILESKDTQNKALVKADLDAKKIFISVNGRTNSRKDLLSLIRGDFDKIHFSIPKLQANEKIPLPNNPNIVADYKHLLVLKENNQTHFIPEGYNKLVSVSELLEGIERKPNINKKDTREHILNEEINTLSVKPLAVNLSGSELKLLHNALLNAFDIDTLEQMVLFELNKDLASITTATSFTNIVFSLISTANKQGWMAQFIIAAKNYVPGNESLNNVIDKLLENR